MWFLTVSLPGCFLNLPSKRSRVNALESPALTPQASRSSTATARVSALPSSKPACLPLGTHKDFLIVVCFQAVSATARVTGTNSLQAPTDKRQFRDMSAYSSRIASHMWTPTQQPSETHQRVSDGGLHRIATSRILKHRPILTSSTLYVVEPESYFECGQKKQELEAAQTRDSRSARKVSLKSKALPQMAQLTELRSALKSAHTPIASKPRRLQLVYALRGQNCGLRRFSDYSPRNSASPSHSAQALAARTQSLR